MEYAQCVVFVLLWLCYGSSRFYVICLSISSRINSPDSKVHGANMGPTWALSAPDGTHVGPMNLAIRVDGTEPIAWLPMFQWNNIGGYRGILSVPHNNKIQQSRNRKHHCWNVLKCSFTQRQKDLVKQFDAITTKTIITHYCKKARR